MPDLLMSNSTRIDHGFPYDLTMASGK